MGAPVTLVWPKRRFRMGSVAAPGAAFTEIERYGEGKGLRYALGDALDVAAALRARGEQADLVYIDPPYASQRAHHHEARLDGVSEAGGGRVVRGLAYDDAAPLGDYLDMLGSSLEALARLLSPRGTIWVHLDWRAAYLVRVLLDEIMGRGRFLNEIVWRRAPNLGRQAASGQFGRTLDTILVYGNEGAVIVPPTRPEPIDDKAVRIDDEGRAFTTAPRGDYTDASIARLDEEGRIHRTQTGRVYVKYFLQRLNDGWVRERRVDALWTDVPPLRHAPPRERTGYPTQKPRALLDRIVGCATRPGDLVVDLFAGSGTTGESACALGRRAVLGDRSSLALATARARFLRAGLDFELLAAGGDLLRASPPEVRVRDADRAGHVVVELAAPAEPLAWAVDSAFDPAAGFRATWHAERALGRGGPFPRTATVPRGPLAVRVWHDDGSLAESMPA